MNLIPGLKMNNNKVEFIIDDPKPKDKKTVSLKNFYQEKEISDDIFNCEFDGVLGTTATIVGATQANEALKLLMEIGKNLKNQILIIDLLNLSFRKVKFK